MSTLNKEKNLLKRIDIALAKKDKKQTYKNWELIFWDNKSSDNNNLEHLKQTHFNNFKILLIKCI